MSKAETNDTTPKESNTEPPQKSLYIDSIEIKNFKRVSQASIELGKITYLVGGNNSGKSSVLQAIHTAFSCARLSLERGKFERNTSGRYSIAPSKALPDVELLYRPTASFIHLGHREPYRGKNNNSGEVRFTGFDPKRNITSELTVLMYKANNHNNAGVELRDDVHDNFKLAIYDDSTLFSVYVPGLTGIPLYEEYKSLGVIRRTAAGGEANLVFRNILHHLRETDLKTLEKLLEKVFNRPAKFDIRFDPNRDQYIDAKLSLGEGDPISVDLWGTGVLQVTQILAYALLFRPKLFLIDEPDSHLHPALQRTLASTFKAITDTLECRIIITTHSRHMLSAAPEGTRVVWMKDGRVENDDAKEVAELLLDLGALDTFDTNASFILLTEDKNETTLTKCLTELQEMKKIPDITVLRYGGEKNGSTLFSLATGIQALALGKHLIVHRDRDCMTDFELEQWHQKLERERRTKAKEVGLPKEQFTPTLPFIPKRTDTESYLWEYEHLCSSINIPSSKAEALVSHTFNVHNNKLYEKFVEKRKAALVYWDKGGSPRTDSLWKEWQNDEAHRHIHGKSFFEFMKKDHNIIKHNQRKINDTASKALCQEILEFFSTYFPEATP